MILGKMQIPLAGGLKTGLISCWEFNEISGTTAVDAKGNLNLVTNATINQTGKLGKCYSYDGSTDYTVSSAVTALYNSLSAFSVSVWYYSDFTSSLSGVEHALVIDGAADYADYKFYLKIEFGSYQRYFFIVRNESMANRYAASAYYSLTTGSWVHLVATWDVSVNSGIPVLYKSNSDVTSATNSYLDMTAFGPTSKNLVIGADTNYYKNFNGKIDQVATWSRALSVAEVSQLYNSGNGKAYTSW
jgi:hypothetical protein